jgi:uncharacterized repeat protein (TIGR01451 family)
MKRVEHMDTDAPTEESPSGKRGDRFLFRWTITKQSNPDVVSTVLVDSLPAGITLIPNSLSVISGIDSISVNENSITAVCNNEATASFIFIGELNAQATTGMTVEHQLTALRRLTDGTIKSERSASLIIRVAQ